MGRSQLSRFLRVLAQLLVRAIPVIMALADATTPDA